ncbi:hypothetical protein SAMN06265218_11572 [Fodinibius sediminis]|uniref:Uncharacterized protein n=1 Tax=Fodinibius sediminis TaxID=1214077 RepID=A0A521EDP8_9BACT|nr:hypothetical protein SAMN06265218_11572 [Fodinibius sediminis]
MVEKETTINYSTIKIEAVMAATRDLSVGE